MFVDSQEYFSTAQAVTSTGDTASTNILDTLAAQDEGIGESMYINALCTTTPTSGGSATIQPVLQTSADNSTWVDASLGPALAFATVAAGTMLWQQKLPVGMRRYARVVWRIGTAALTAGNFSAFFTKDLQAAPSYATGFTVQ